MSAKTDATRAQRPTSVSGGIFQDFTANCSVSFNGGVEVFSPTANSCQKFGRNSIQKNKVTQEDVCYTTRIK